MWEPRRLTNLWASTACYSFFKHDKSDIFLAELAMFTEFGLVIGFTGVLKVGTTSNYNSLTDLHSLHFNAARTVSSVCCIFTGCRLVTASNTADPSASVFHGSGPHWLSPISQLDVAWIQSSNKGYSSRPYDSRTALPNRCLKTLLLCRWPPNQGPGPPPSCC
jgi:hypothetical protein